MNSTKSISILSVFFVSSLVVASLDEDVKALTTFMMLKTPSPTFLMRSKIALALPTSSVPSSVLSSAVLQSLTGKIIRC